MKAKLGQNFLINKHAAQREIEYADISKKDVVLEIGPGNGIITRLLAEKAKKVIAIEIDENLINNLSYNLPDNVELIHADAVKYDFDKLPVFNKIVSNLPYQISSPITFKFFKYGFELAVLIYQKEFGERLVATEGKKYSRLSVNSYYWAEAELLETIPRSFFNPQPKVDSCIIRLKRRYTPPFILDNENFFFNLTNLLFSQRRKKIKNILPQSKDIKNSDIPFLNCRVEEISPENIGELSNILLRMGFSL